MGRIAAWAVLGLTLLAPLSITGSFTDIREFERHLHHETDTNGVVAQFTTTIPPLPYSYTQLSRESVWAVYATYESQDPTTGTNTGTFDLRVDGSSVCTWTVTRTAIVGLIQEVGHTFNILCNNTTAVQPGDHTVEIAVTGTNPVVQAYTSIGIRQVDQVTDATLDFIKPNFVYTNGLLNQTQNYQNAQLNATYSNLHGEDYAKWQYALSLTNRTQDYQNVLINGTAGEAQADFSFTNALLNQTYLNLHNEDYAKWAYSNARLNTTYVNLYGQVRTRTAYTNLLINNTVGEFDFTGANVTVNQTGSFGLLGLAAFPGFTDDATSVLIAMGVLMIWCIWMGLYWPGFGAMLALLSQIVLGSNFFVWSILIIIMGFGFEIFNRNSPSVAREREGRKRDAEDSQGYG